MQAAAASDADAVDKPSPTTNVQLSTLRRIEQLVGMLDIVGDGQQHQAAASDVVDICHELLGVLTAACNSVIVKAQHVLLSAVGGAWINQLPRLTQGYCQRPASCCTAGSTTLWFATAFR